MICRPEGNKTLLRSPILLCVALFIFTPLLFAEKTDVVVLKSGVRLIGEIKEMDRGSLRYKTDDMRTVYIDWTKILRIISTATHDILMHAGVRYQGSLEDSGQDGEVVIVTEAGRITEDIQSIVMIVPLETRFWQRFKGFISLGVDIQKAKTQRTFTSRSNISYHHLKWEINLEGDNYINTRDDADRISRNSVLLGYERFTKRLWSILGFGKLQQNDELNLDLRASLGAGVGRYFVKNNFLELTGIALISVNNEKYAESEDEQQNLEAGFLLNFQAFRYHDPDLDLQVHLRILPNLTDWGRVRIEFSTSVDYEILKDLYVTLHFFDNYDSRPPPYGDVTKNDYGMDFAITWKFD